MMGGGEHCASDEVTMMDQWSRVSVMSSKGIERSEKDVCC